MIRLVEYTSDIGDIEKDGQSWNKAVIGTVTCDGALMYEYELRQCVKQRVDEIVKENPGSIVSEWGLSEKFHKADMAYGKNRDVVTWGAGLCVRYSEPTHPRNAPKGLSDEC